MCLTASITILCADESAVGGFKNLYVASRDSVVSFTKGALHLYNAVSMASTAVGDQWHEIGSKDYTIALEATNELSDNGPNFVNTSLTLTVPKIDKTKSAQLNALKECCKVVVIAVTNEGNAFVYGWDDRVEEKGALRTQVNTTVGAGLGDPNQYTLTFTGQQVELPYNFEGTILVSGSPVVIS
jgi:hypothetical protein